MRDWPNHYSYSQKSEFCGRKLWYRCRDERKIKPPPTASMQIGNIVEDGVRLLLDNRMGVTRNESIESVVSASMEKRVFGMESSEATKVVEALPKMCDMVALYERHIDYEPICMQAKIHLKIKGVRRPFTGYADIVAKRGDSYVIIDLKTKEKKPSKPQEGWVQQLALYAIWGAFEYDLSELPATENHVLIRRKNDVDFVKFDNWVSEKDVSELILTARDLEWRVENDYFPINRSHTLCDSRYCGFYELCHEEVKVDEAEVYRAFAV